MVFSKPFSKSVKTNIGGLFIRLVGKHFTREHKFYKIFNKHTKVLRVIQFAKDDKRNLFLCQHLFSISEHLFIMDGLLDLAMTTFSARHRLHRRVPHLQATALLSIVHLIEYGMFFSFRFHINLDRVVFFRLYSSLNEELCLFHLVLNGLLVDP